MKKTMLFLLLCIFSFVIIACDEVQEDIHQLAIDSISISYESGDSSLAVTKNITLPTTSSYEGVTFSWTSSEPTIISATGVVTRPVGGSNVSVMLILTATYNGEEKERIFYLTVIPLSEEDVLYTVTFNSNGGTAINSVLVLEGETVNAPLQPTRVGFTFDGWYSDAGLSTAWNFSTGIVNDDLTLYAKWNPIGVSFTITFESNGGSAVGNINVAENGKITKPADPTKSGFAFDGWYKESNLTTGWNFTVDVVTSNVTLYAKWVPVIPMFTVSFNSNLGSSVGNIIVEENDLIVQPADPIKEGFSFEGWYKESSLDTLWVFESDVVTSDITLYAKWEKILVYYTISFDSNFGSIVSDMEVLEDELIDKPSDPTRNGYTFLGWFKEETLDTLWDFDAEIVSSEFTLYAKWELTNPESEVFTVTFNSNGGNFDKAFEVVEGFTIEEPVTPIKTASIFLGWFTDVELLTEWDFETNLVSSNFTLYAKWEINPDELPKLPTPVNGINHDAPKYHFGIGPYDQGGGIGYSGQVEILIVNTVTLVETREVISAVYGQGIAFNYEHLNLPSGSYTMTFKAIGNHTTHGDSLYYVSPFAFNVSPKAVGKPQLTILGSILSWNEVTHASSYNLFINNELKEESVSSPIDLASFELEPGVYSIKVVAIPVDGYLQNDGVISYTVVDDEIEPLQAPSNLVLTGDVLSWDTVANAVSYIVFIDGTTNPTNTNSFDLATLNKNGTFDVTVIAKADGVFYIDSNPSEPISYVATSSVTPLIAFVAGDLAGEGGGLVNTHGGGMFRNFVVHAFAQPKLTQDGNAAGIRIRVYAPDGITLLGEQDYPTIPANWNITSQGFPSLLQAGNIIHIQIRPSEQGITNGYTYSTALIYTLKA